MIPNRMAFFFAGEHLSWSRYLSLLSFRKLNPDWEMQLWTTASNPGTAASWSTNESQDFEFFNRGKNYWHDAAGMADLRIIYWEWPEFLKGANPVHLSDFCRWDVLERYGGWYADTDILWVRSMKAGGLDNYEADAALIERGDHVPIGFLGGRAGAGLYGRIFEAATKFYDPTDYQSAGCDAVLAALDITKAKRIAMRMRPHSIRGMIVQKFNVDAAFLPPATVYPFDSTESHKIFSESHALAPGVVGLHWFGGSRPAQRFNQLTDETNYRLKKNTFCVYARSVIDS